MKEYQNDYTHSFEPSDLKLRSRVVSIIFLGKIIM